MKKSTILTAAGCSENQLRKVLFFMTILQNYKTLVRNKKTTALTAARSRENWPNRLDIILDKKSMALKEAGCCENKLKKISIFTEIRQSYETKVSRKSTAFTAARYGENWPN